MRVWVREGGMRAGVRRFHYGISMFGVRVLGIGLTVGWLVAMGLASTP